MKSKYIRAFVFLFFIFFSLFNINTFELDSLYPNKDIEQVQLDSSAEDNADTQAKQKEYIARNEKEQFTTSDTAVNGESDKSFLNTDIINNNPRDKSTNEKIDTTFDYKKDVPHFKGNPSVIINNNVPYFPKETNTRVYKLYSELDNLNRVGSCEVVTGKELLPSEKRGEISDVKPTGWKQKKYDFIDGKYLYNRCHLIGFQIAGDNDNWKNLMTGTRYLNVQGMLPYENKIVEYIKKTNNHVKYKVTPIFLGDELVARGVLMEAQSIEDNGLCFNVFCYNVQPNITINYLTGQSQKNN